MSKTVILSGSPRKEGDSEYIVKAITNKLDGEIKVYRSYDLNVSPCLDCRYCTKNIGCVIDDEMQQIYKDIFDADNIIIASPIHFSELSGSLLSLCSRFQMLFCADFIHKKELFERNKKGVIILTAAGDTTNNDCAFRTAKIMLKTLGATNFVTACSYKTSIIPINEDKDLEKDINNAIKFLNQQ